jgi:SnoaL-like protein
VPSISRVNEFVALVLAGGYIEAIEQFYATDATTQDNGGPLRVGQGQILEHERRTLTSLSAIRTVRAERLAVDENVVVINWVFQMTYRDGSTRTLDELALQEWRGDDIAKERFFYDSDQLPRGRTPTIS